MDVLWYLLLLALLIVALLLTALDYPGTWLMVLAVFGYYRLTHHAYFGWITLAILCGLAVLAEAVDWAIGSGAGAKRAGARRRGKIGGTLGGILGGIFLTFLLPVPILGTIVGIVAGCFLGAMLFEMTGDRQTSHALAIGVGAAKGRLTGILAKIAFGLLILLLSLYAGFPHHARKSALKPLLPATRPTTTIAVTSRGFESLLVCVW